MLNVIIVMATGISDRGYLSMENTILNSVCLCVCFVLSCVAMCLSLVSVSLIKKTSVCENVCFL